MIEENGKLQESCRATAPDLDVNLGKTLPVLDKGFIRVIDYMGNDAAIVQAARTSFGQGTKTPSKDEALIRRLMREYHTSPFEMCEIKLHVKLPMFVARQWIRHRTANVNEYSARYSILSNEFYLPEQKDMKPQSKIDKQGRDGVLPNAATSAMRATIEMHSASSYDLYEELLHGWPWFDEAGVPVDSPDPELHRGEMGLSRELARMVVPTNVYTEWYWKIDLHNLMHFVSLRLDSHAQFEIRQYAAMLADIVAAWCPMTFRAFMDYRYDAARMSRMEMVAVKAAIDRLIQIGDVSDTRLSSILDLTLKSAGEESFTARRNFFEKVGLPAPEKMD